MSVPDHRLKSTQKAHRLSCSHRLGGLPPRCAHRAQLEAFNQLNASVTEQDLPVLTEAMKSETSNFWVRELLAEPICRLGGAKAISQLMAALRRNFDDGHDNDGFQAFLADLAESDPKGVKAELEKLRKTANKAELEDIQWLLEFCQ